MKFIHNMKPELAEAVVSPSSAMENGISPRNGNIGKKNHSILENECLGIIVESYDSYRPISENCIKAAEVLKAPTEIIVKEAFVGSIKKNSNSHEEDDTDDFNLRLSEDEDDSQLNNKNGPSPALDCEAKISERCAAVEKELINKLDDSSVKSTTSDIQISNGLDVESNLDVARGSSAEDTCSKEEGATTSTAIHIFEEVQEASVIPSTENIDSPPTETIVSPPEEIGKIDNSLNNTSIEKDSQDPDDSISQDNLAIENNLVVNPSNLIESSSSDSQSAEQSKLSASEEFPNTEHETVTTAERDIKQEPKETPCEPVKDSVSSCDVGKNDQDGLSPLPSEEQKMETEEEEISKEADSELQDNFPKLSEQMEIEEEKTLRQADFSSPEAEGNACMDVTVSNDTTENIESLDNAVSTDKLTSDSENKTILDGSRDKEETDSSVESSELLKLNAACETSTEISTNADLDFCKSSSTDETDVKCSRKRPLTPSDLNTDDLSPKDANGWTAEKTGNELVEEKEDSFEKTILVQTKKVKLCEELQWKSREVLEEERRNKVEEEKRAIEEKTKLEKLKHDANPRNVPISQPLCVPKTNMDHAIERVVAKAASSAAPDEPQELPFLRKFFKGKISELTRSDLEDLVLQKICEAITETSVVGQLRSRCKSVEHSYEQLKEKYNSLRKQINELNVVLQKHNEQVQTAGDAGRISTPLRVTRSVGMQVDLQNRRPLGQLGSRPRNSCREVEIQTGRRQDLLAGAKQPGTPKSLALSQNTQVSVMQPQNQVPSRGIFIKAPGTPPRPAVSTQMIPGPPALVKTTGTVMVAMPMPVSSAGQRLVSPPARMSTPQPQSPRPRLNIPASFVSTSAAPQVVRLQQKKPIVTNTLSKNDVEVIDIIDKDDPAKRSNVLRVSAPPSTPGSSAITSNSGLTVRLISPNQVTQSGVTLAAVQPLFVPSQGGQAKMIIASTAQTKGNVKGPPTHVIMKGANQANLLIPLQQSTGVTVSSAAVVHAVATATGQPLQQVFTNATAGSRTTTVATVRPQLQSRHPLLTHPAPLPNIPLQPNNPGWKLAPPRPSLKLQHQNNGIVLSWNMNITHSHADVKSYQIFAYQEGPTPPSTLLWKKVGDVAALPLPMACTLTQFMEGHRYHFSVRAIDSHDRMGPFSLQQSIRLINQIKP